MKRFEATHASYILILLAITVLLLSLGIVIKDPASRTTQNKVRIFDENLHNRLHSTHLTEP